MLFTSGPFKPGYVTEAQAAELNRLWSKVAAFDRLATTAPVTVTRLGDGQPVIGLGGLEATVAQNGWAVKGKLDGSLAYQGSATMSVWYYNGSADADTGDNLTVYDWLLSSGQSIASGKQVVAVYDTRSERWYVVGTQCS